MLFPQLLSMFWGLSRLLWGWERVLEGESESGSRSVTPTSLPPHRLYSSWNSPGQNTTVDSHSLFQGIFPTQELNPGLPHCRKILYQLSHQGSPLEGNGRKSETLLFGKKKLAPERWGSCCLRFMWCEHSFHWLLATSPRKEVLWVTTATWHPGGAHTVKGIPQSGWEPVQTDSTSTSHPQRFCICRKVRTSALSCRPVKEGYIPQRSS